MNIAIIDDDDDVRYSINRVLTLEEHICYEFEGREIELYDALKELDIDLIITDMMLEEELTGVDIVEKLHQLDIKIPVVLITAYTNSSNIIRASQVGIVDILQKPFDAKELLSLLGSYEKVSSTDEKLTILTGEDSFIGSYQTMGDVYKKIGVGANCDLSVLINGETGTGKELVAKMIHLNSHRKDQPFVAINCAAIPSELFESQLFGHEKGSFSSAEKRQIGYVEETGRGTLFLDEIGELTPALQTKLLRFLETKRFRRLGASTEQNFQGRIISATNIDIASMIEKKYFRDDLYYRLAMITINLPSLAQRKDDIEELSYYFIQIANEELHTNIKYLNKQALKLLHNHYYRGNIRELRNILYNAVSHAKHETISEHDIKRSFEILANNDTSYSDELFYEMILNKHGVDNAEKIFQEIEKKLLTKLLQKCSNISKLAKSLNIARNTLKAKLNYYEIKKD